MQKIKSQCLFYTMYTKSISKWIINISVEAKIIKCKDENLGNNISPLCRFICQWGGHIDGEFAWIMEEGHGNTTTTKLPH